MKLTKIICMLCIILGFWEDIFSQAEVYTSHHLKGTFPQGFFFLYSEQTCEYAFAFASNINIVKLPDGNTYKCTMTFFIDWNDFPDLILQEGKGSRRCKIKVYFDEDIGPYHTPDYYFIADATISAHGLVEVLFFKTFQLPI